MMSKRVEQMAATDSLITTLATARARLNVARTSRNLQASSADNWFNTKFGSIKSPQSPPFAPTSDDTSVLDIPPSIDDHHGGFLDEDGHRDVHESVP